MRFDTKIAVVVLADLPTWQKLNVVAFIASGVAVLRVTCLKQVTTRPIGLRSRPRPGRNWIWCALRCGPKGRWWTRS